MVKYKPSAFEIEKEWNTATPSENKELLEEIGASSDYSSYGWNELPQRWRRKISEHIEKEEYIMPPRAGMSKEVLEPQWTQIDCENHGGEWVKGFYRDGTWIQGYCRRKHD